MNKQQGSAQTVVIIVLVIALIGVLGFLFWQNYSMKDDKAVQTDASNAAKNAEDSRKATAKTYENDRYSFSYPAKGWTVTEVKQPGASNVSTELRTSDFKLDGADVKQGAYVAIYANPSERSLAENKEGFLKLASVKDMKDRTLGGEKALSFKEDLEADRYTVFSIKGDTEYVITYQFAGDNESLHKDGFDMLIDSFKFK